MTKTATRLPEFRGKSLIVIPDVVPQGDFLTGDFGKAFLQEYNALVASDFDNNKVLRVLSYNNGIVKGSNPFAVVLANQILNQEGIRTASPADLEKALQANAINLRGTYEDSALVLRTAGEPNEYLAQNLAEQLEAKGYKIGKNALVIPLNGLRIRKDAGSSHGLSYVVQDGTQVIEAPILGRDGSFSSADINAETGLPSKLSGGDRTLYTRNSGLSGLYLDSGLGLNSDGDDLADSNVIGRVVGVRGEAAGAEQLRTLYAQKESELLQRTEQARKQLNEGYKAAMQTLSSK